MNAPASTSLTVPTQSTGFGLVMSPKTLQETRDFCEMLARTEFVPKAFRGKPDSIMVVGAMGARLGVDVFSAMAGIADINGRPSIYGDLMLAVVLNHPAYEDHNEVSEGKPYEDAFTAVCTVKRKGKEPKVGRFSVADAKKAQLWGKAGPWSSTPQRMLQMRARSFALRDAFADALAGFHSREEMEDAQEAEVLSVRTEPAPARTGAPPSVEAPPKPADPPKEQPKPPHPAIAASRDLYKVLNAIEKGLGKKITDRLCALQGAADPLSVPADKLDQFGKDVAEIAALAADRPRFEDLLSQWEHAAKEAVEGDKP